MPGVSLGCEVPYSEPTLGSLWVFGRTPLLHAERTTKVLPKVPDGCSTCRACCAPQRPATLPGTDIPSVVRAQATEFWGPVLHSSSGHGYKAKSVALLKPQCFDPWQSDMRLQAQYQALEGAL